MLKASYVLNRLHYSIRNAVMANTTQLSDFFLRGSNVSTVVGEYISLHVLGNILCAYCGSAAHGNYSIHRDGFGVGPEVPLCDLCGQYAEPELAEIWDAIAQPSTNPFAYRRVFRR